MAIKKQFLKSKPVCKVTFSLPAEEAKKVSVVGSFNEWNAKKAPLKKLKNGKKIIYKILKQIIKKTNINWYDLRDNYILIKKYIYIKLNKYYKFFNIVIFCPEKLYTVSLTLEGLFK